MKINSVFYKDLNEKGEFQKKKKNQKKDDIKIISELQSIFANTVNLTQILGLNACTRNDFFRLLGLLEITEFISLILHL